MTIKSSGISMLSSELVRSVLDSAPDAMLLIDADGRIVFANDQLSALFGYGRDEIIGESVDSLLPHRFRDRHVGHRQQYRKSGQLRPMGIGLDLFALRKDGSEFPVEISLSPISDGAASLVAAAIRDVTARQQIEAEIKAARDAADHANQAKSRFLATASHDLRQPLQVLALLNGSLNRMVSDPEVTDVLARQAQAVEAMSRLLNTLLDISKLESGAIRPEIADVTVASLFEELRGEFAGLASSKGLALTIEPCADAVRTDPSLIGQVLRNLVSNAIKYTNRGWVALRCLHEKTLVRIEILDTGVGIRSDQLPYIYDEFFQVGVSTNTSRDGYGLGLSIVQRVVQLLDVKLEVESEVGRGSKFTLELPASGRTVVAAKPVSAKNERVSLDSRPHVLLVEDDAAVRNATEMLLKVGGYKVTAVASRKEALGVAAEQGDIDVVVTDFHLEGGETGTQVISSLRDVLGGRFKAVLMTGDTSSAIKDLNRDVLLRVASKPINADAFLAMLEELLSV